MSVSTSVKAAYVGGIVLAGINLMNCFGNLGDIVVGIVGALISGILVYGTHCHNTGAILAWIILALLDISANIYRIVGKSNFLLIFYTTKWQAS